MNVTQSIRVEHIMGMPIGIDVRAPAIDPAALDVAFDWLRWVDETFSTYRTDSAISRLNRHELLEEDLPPEVGVVLTRCRALAEETDGYFDMRVAISPHDRRDNAVLTPHAIDPSGLVKGWAIDRAGSILEEAGARSYSINAGGDILLRGGAAPGTGWHVGIQHPLRRDKLAAVLTATDLAVATSGAYERGTHIIDPYTGRPPDGVLSVTIAGPTLATADAYATAAYAMGRAGPAWTATLAERGYEALTILADETVYITPGFPLAR